MRNDIRHINQKELVTGKLSQSSSTSTPFTLSNYYNVAVGISHTPSGKELGTDFGWFLASTAKTRDIHVGGVYQTNLNSPRLFQNGDVYRIWRNNGNVEFYVNGLLDGTFTDKYPDRPMYLEVSFFDPDKKVENLYIYKEVLKTHDTITSSKMVAVNGGYRYGYQGSERDDQVKSKGNSYSTEFRLLDPRLGRWLTIDPLSSDFPSQSPYVSMDNNPTNFNDTKGQASENVVSKLPKPPKSINFGLFTISFRKALYSKGTKIPKIGMKFSWNITFTKEKTLPKTRWKTKRFTINQINHSGTQSVPNIQDYPNVTAGEATSTGGESFEGVVNGLPKNGYEILSAKLKTKRNDNGGNSYYKFNIDEKIYNQENKNRKSILDPRNITPDSNVEGELYNQTPNTDGNYDSCDGYKLIIRVQYPILIVRNVLKKHTRAPSK